MGRLVYGDDTQPFDIDDATLVHLRLVIMNKLRRREPFTLQLPSPQGIGWHSLWIGPAVPLLFQFYSQRQPNIDPSRVDEMMREASGPDGLAIETRNRE